MKSRCSLTIFVLVKKAETKTYIHENEYLHSKIQTTLLQRKGKQDSAALCIFGSNLLSNQRPELRCHVRMLQLLQRGKEGKR